MTDRLLSFGPTINSTISWELLLRNLPSEWVALAP